MIISNARKTECRRLFKAARQAEIRNVTRFLPYTHKRVKKKGFRRAFGSARSPFLTQCSCSFFRLFLKHENGSFSPVLPRWARPKKATAKSHIRHEKVSLSSGKAATFKASFYRDRQRPSL